MKRLKDKVAIVTGAGDGIGRGIALAFANQGAKLAVCDLHNTVVMETAAMVREMGAEVIAESIDVRNPAKIQSFVAEVKHRFGRIDCLVNNAAVMPIALADSIEPETIDLILQVNLRAPILFSRFVISSMREVGGGSIHSLWSHQRRSDRFGPGPGD
jgi:3-oxoacyl-[acyl-carrier protein] reductase